MASKLFHAVVGVGISVGSVSACGGSTSDDSGAFGSPDANVPELPSEGGVDAGTTLPKADAQPPKLDAQPADAGPATDGSADATPDASPEVDAAPPDAAPDVVEDAIVAAFCDATWPITKSGREVCGPADECWGLAIPWCYGPDGQGGCKLYPLECVGAEWHCMGGVVPTMDPGTPAKCQ